MSATVDGLSEAIEMAKRGRQSMVKCLAHDDGTASVHVSPGTAGQPVTIRCHANCETEDVLRAAGVEWADVCAPLEQSVTTTDEWTPKGPASHIYTYHDEEGHPLYQALRVPLAGGRKHFFQRHFQGEKTIWNLNGVRRVLYRLPSLLKAKDAGQDIWLFEGEKDVETAVLDNLTATCNPMGAGSGKWLPEYTETLRGCRVHIVADADEVGREHARQVAEALTGADCDVTIYESPLGKDYTDHRSQGGTVETLVITYRSDSRRNTRPEYGIRQMVGTDFSGGVEIIPGYFAEANVAIIVGPEGFGKSLLMRQMAVQCAAGINPFTSAVMEPLRTMFIDGENPEHQQVLDWRKLDRLATRYRRGVEIENDALTIIAAWEDAPSLITQSGTSWLMERITAHQPQICFLGPVSDLVDGKLSDDDVVRKFKRVLYKARAICGTAFIVEHHSPHRMQGDKTREMRPYGSSVFRRFPDFGYGIQPTQDQGMFELAPFRGARVRDRAWPDRLRWGNPSSMEWPWEFGEDVAGSVSVGNFGQGA